MLESRTRISEGRDEAVIISAIASTDKTSRRGVGEPIFRHSLKNTFHHQNEEIDECKDQDNTRFTRIDNGTTLLLICRGHANG